MTMVSSSQGREPRTSPPTHMSDLFSDREGAPRPRTKSTIERTSWEGILALILALQNDGSLGYGFPERCFDSPDPTGTDVHSFRRHVTAHVPEIEEQVWYSGEPPPTLAILDFVELVANSIGEPIERSYHEFPRHRHLAFDRQAGLARFVTDINRLLARGGIAFQMDGAGTVRRLGPPLLRDALAEAVFHTGDRDTDQLLGLAMERILSPKPQDRIDALEKLWDAFERVKTLEPGADKKKSVNALLDRAAADTGIKFRQVLEDEANALTKIGNEFRIRHSETDKEPLRHSEQIDALFQRMFAFVRFILNRTGREG